MNVQQTNLEDAFQGLFGNLLSGTGEEELLRLASSYSLQFTSKQIRLLLYLQFVADYHEIATTGDKTITPRLRNFITEYKSLKQYNNSDIYVMRALESIALRKFINENSIRVNVEKK